MSVVNQLENAFGSDIIEATETEFRANCPKCKDSMGASDTKYHLYVNPFKKRRNNVTGLMELGTWNCFRCSWRGWGLEKLGANLEEETTARPFQSLLDLLEEGDDDREGDNILLEVAQKSKKANDSPKGIEFPKGYRTDWSDSLTGQAAHKYLKSRGVSNDQISKYKMGYCSSGVYAGFIILPVFEADVLVYFVARSIFDKVYKNAPVSSKNILFNFNPELKTICLTEGIFDALSVGRFGVAMLGKNMKGAQAQRIIGGGFETVYICLDDDAQQNALNIANTLKDHIPNVIMVTLGPGNDPNSVTKAQLLKAFTDATKIETNFDTLRWMLDA